MPDGINNDAFSMNRVFAIGELVRVEFYSKDTRSIFYITFTAYWVLGLPSGYILALTDLVVEPMGPAGFWIGFIIGLTSAAIMMMLRMRFLQRLPSAIILQRASR